MQGSGVGFLKAGIFIITGNCAPKAGKSHLVKFFLHSKMPRVLLGTVRGGSRRDAVAQSHPLTDHTMATALLSP